MGLIPQETRAAIITDLQAGEKYSVIAARYQVSKNAVSKIALKNGMRRMNRVPLLSESQAAEVVARYAKGDRTPEIAAAFGVSRDLVWSTLARAGVAARNPSKAHVRHPLNHNALDVLTADAAYWCGFIFTDGGIVRRAGAPELAVVLQKRDRGHLVKLRDFLGSGHAITPVAPCKVGINPGQGSGAFRYSVRSQCLADRVAGLGRYGPAVDAELAASRDFWRGAIDGGGTVGISCDIPQCKLVGSKWLLGAFVDFLGPVGRRPLNVRPARSIFVVSVSGSTAEKVLDRLYSGATTALDRKSAAVAEILGGARPG